jgi:hypothetical protein
MHSKNVYYRNVRDEIVYIGRKYNVFFVKLYYRSAFVLENR